MKVAFDATFSVSMSAAEWALFCNQPGVDLVANRLSIAASNALAKAWKAMTGPENLSAFEVENLAVREWQAVALTIERDFGASDSEPRNIMRELAGKVLGAVPAETVGFLRASR